MLSAHSVENMVVGWTWTPGRASRAREEAREPWRDLDHQLRSIAKKRAALDAEELALIRDAVRVQLWRPLGMVSMRDYLESRLGYGPQVAAERLRVAEALDALPAIEAALTTGELSYSAVRELTRIATRKTDDAWVKACRGRNLRQIEELVAEREVGDAPTSRPKPQVRRRRVSMDLQPATFARLREARKVLEAERGERLDDDELMAMLLARALEAAPAGKTRKPRHQIAVTVCRVCKQGWQTGGGREIPISATDVECARCDAEQVSLEDPGKPTPSIPEPTRKLVFRRDHDRCTVPTCRSTRNLDVHHIIHREHGGTHVPENLTLLCAGHHRAHHDGKIAITGRAPEIEVRWLVEVPHVGDPEDADGMLEESVAEQARSALRNLGCTRAESSAAVARAIARVGDADVLAVIRAALRECAKPPR